MARQPAISDGCPLVRCHGVPGHKYYSIVTDERLLHCAEDRVMLVAMHGDCDAAATNSPSGGPGQSGRAKSEPLVHCRG